MSIFWGVTMSIESLLSRLDRVKSIGTNRWIASAPTRSDKHPSMSIRLLDDGRILLHDFGGDSVDAILGAIGMDFRDLFPDSIRADQRVKPERRPFMPSDVFEIARLEVGVAAVIAAEMHRDKQISDPDYLRLFEAAGRLTRIAEAAYGSR